MEMYLFSIRIWHLESDKYDLHECYRLEKIPILFKTEKGKKVNDFNEYQAVCILFTMDMIRLFACIKNTLCIILFRFNLSVSHATLSWVVWSFDG